MMNYISKLAYLLGLPVFVGASILCSMNVADSVNIVNISIPLESQIHRTKLHSLYLGSGSYSTVKVSNDGVLSVLNGIIMGEKSTVGLNKLVSIGGGKNNAVNGDMSGIGGGYGNKIYTPRSIIGGGSSNEIAGGTEIGVIAGGQSNKVNSGGIVAGGYNNESRDGGTVIGGYNNQSYGRNGLVLGRNSKGGEKSFSWNSSIKSDNSAIIMAESGVLIGTYQPIQGVNLVVNGAMRIGSNSNLGIAGEIRIQSGCFYAYDGKVWHVLNRGKGSAESCPIVMCDFGSTLLQEGDTAIGYKKPYAEKCTGEKVTLTCNSDGTMGNADSEYYSYCYELSGSGIPTNYVAPDFSCTFNGVTIPNGGSVTGYLAASVPYGSTCQSAIRTCDHGALSNNQYSHASCEVGAPSSCTGPCGSTGHNGTLTCYQNAAPVCPSSCQLQTRTCKNGSWYNGETQSDFTSTYTVATCNVQGKSCEGFNLTSQSDPNATYASCTTYTVSNNSCEVGSTKHKETGCKSGYGKKNGVGSCLRTCDYGGTTYYSGDKLYNYYTHDSETCPTECFKTTFTCSSDGEWKYTRNGNTYNGTPHGSCSTVSESSSFTLDSCPSTSYHICGSDTVSISNGYQGCNSVLKYQVTGCKRGTSLRNGNCCFDTQLEIQPNSPFSCSSCYRAGYNLYSSSNGNFFYKPTGTLTCFTKGTQVLMADGTLKNIEDVKIGDEVKGELGINRVLGYARPKLGNRHLWSINGGEYFVSDEHPFMTTEGWKSFNPEMTKMEMDLDTTELEIGDKLVTSNGYEEIKVIDYIQADSDTQLYNFLLDGDHTYYANNYLVHNKDYNPSNDVSSYCRVINMNLEEEKPL